MTDLERVCMAEDEFLASDIYFPKKGESFIPKLNQFLAENYGVRYISSAPAIACVEVIDPMLYTFLVLKWP